MNSIALLAKLIKDSKKIAVLTGAGISTSAGIPDFRGPKGLYSRKDISADKLFDITYFKEDPNFFYSVIPEFFKQCTSASPTKGHIFVKKLQDIGKLNVLVTQNIDGLHDKAGNTDIIDIHGNFNDFKCVKCFSSVKQDEKIRQTIAASRVPLCQSCGGILKPTVVFFGESVIGFEEAAMKIQQSDLLLTIGTSLAVNPAAALPQYLSNNASFVIINKGSTPYDSTADLVVSEDIDYVAEKLIATL